MTTDSPLRIAIVGAGIGGLTLSAALGLLGKDRNLEVNLYESASEISAIGAGITFWPRQWRIMKALGIDDALHKFSPNVPDDLETLVFQIRKSDQKHGFYIDDLIVKGGSYRFHRADLQSALMGHMKGGLHLSHQLLSYQENDEEVILRFANGTTAKCDLLIGMDGIKSEVRREFLQSQGQGDSPSIEPSWLGQVVYRGLVSEESLDKLFPGHRALTTPMLYSGKNKHMITYPVQHTTKLINIGAIVTDPSKRNTPYDEPPVQVTKKELGGLFSHFEPEVQALLSAIEKPMKWPIKCLIPLEKYAHGRVILGGDAAHAMPPYQGAGAGVAMEDAYVLAHLIANTETSRATITRVATVYDAVRRPEGNRVLNDSIACGDISQLRGPGLEDVEEGDTETISLEKLKASFKDLGAYMEWLWIDNAEEGLQKALLMLKEQL